MNVVIIGLGSIAQKHIKALKLVHPGAKVFALRRNRDAESVEGVANIYSLNDLSIDVDFFLVSNPTSLHYSTLESLLAFRLPVFLEKPPLLNLEAADALVRSVKETGILVYCAFNLRFHPLIAWAKEYLAGKKVLEVTAYCGSYLPDWRPGVDYRRVYSAREELGGGVHLDLIHELDYLIYLFGQPNEIAHKLAKVSSLEISSVDAAYYWLEYEGFTANISLNYFRRTPKRQLEIVLEDEVFQLDLINYKVWNGHGELLFQQTPNIQQTYNRQMEFFIKAIKDKSLPMNDFESAVETLKICLHES